MRKLVVIFILFVCCSKKSEEITYYKRGEIKCKCALLNGLKNGKETCFFKEGTVKINQYWVEGRLEGLFEEFYSNSRIYNKGTYVNNRLNGELFFWDSLGRLIEIRNYIDDTLIDFKKFDRHNKSLLDIEYRRPVFYNKDDTISLGDVYKTKIRIGNREYDRIKILIIKIDTLTDEFLVGSFSRNAAFLPNVDSITAYYEAKPSKRGLFHFEGIIYEIDSLTVKGEITIYPRPFEKDIYVR
jgi:hypothetical protein